MRSIFQSIAYLIPLLTTVQLLQAQSNTFPATGNVGIGTGTTTPSNALTVISSSSPAYFQYTGTANSAITFANASNHLNLGIGSATPHGYLWSNTGSFFIGNDGGPTFFISGMANGNVGINMSNPAWNLDVNGSIHSNNILVVDAQGANTAAAWLKGTASGDANLILQGGAGNWQAFWLTATLNMFRIGNNGGVEPNTGVINIDYTGHMAVGGNPVSNYILDVYGNLRANQVVVNTTGADFVFDSAYKLPSLHQLEKYIHANHHLPDVAPAKQMQEEGVNVGDNQTMLLKKIEELTLYIIEQDKKMAQMQAQLDELKAHRK
ncbi:hypothetical protein [Puia dinghuensis]|uniref:BZIP transcription factor n=1 Tax=Puia dinghuensis TaxID=1792502 RepID=A0A8J2UDL6_9BACT|nr:hypothetical protein [Puia dinghuensis]GGB02979.1 hypothetical protein GCM10011511_27850 [Puia dinghuensis]